MQVPLKKHYGPTFFFLCADVNAPSSDFCFNGPAQDERRTHDSNRQEERTCGRDERWLDRNPPQVQIPTASSPGSRTADVALLFLLLLPFPPPPRLPHRRRPSLPCPHSAAGMAQWGDTPTHLPNPQFCIPLNSSISVSSAVVALLVASRHGDPDLWWGVSASEESAIEARMRAESMGFLYLASRVWNTRGLGFFRLAIMHDWSASPCWSSQVCVSRVDLASGGVWNGGFPGRVATARCSPAQVLRSRHTKSSQGPRGSWTSGKGNSLYVSLSPVSYLHLPDQPVSCTSIYKFLVMQLA